VYTPLTVRQGFRHHLQSLGSELGEQHRRARDIPARPRESGDVSQADRVGMGREHDGITCGTLEGKAKKPDARRFRLLRARCERPRRRRAAEQRSGCGRACVTWATSKAPTSSLNGNGRKTSMSCPRVVANALSKSSRALGHCRE
jgi:U3 small nucleolar ribonucleoprotein component